jgi:transcriptional regulator with XRE-family HTH domain
MLAKKSDHKQVMRDYRFKAGLSQAEMAEKMNMRQQLYSNVETGRTKLSVEFAQSFKKITGLDLITPKNEHIVENTPTPVLTQQQDDECSVLRERLSMKEEIIAALKAQIALMERVIGK